MDPSWKAGRLDLGVNYAQPNAGPVLYLPESRKKHIYVPASPFRWLTHAVLPSARRR